MNILCKMQFKCGYEFRCMKKLIRNLLPYLGDNIFNRICYCYLHIKNKRFPKPLNLTNPRRFNEKIIWLKTNYRHPNASLFADKVAVKDFVSKKVGPGVIIPTLGIFNRGEDIKFDTLPNTFIIKANHGSGWNWIVKDKKRINKIQLVSKVNEWMNKNYYNQSLEYQYKEIRPKVLIEKLLSPKDQSDLRDFKFFCFHGKPQIIQVDFDRQISHKRNFFDLDWNRLHFTSLYPSFEGNLKKPKHFSKMLLIAKKLSKNFPHIRVDLYECNDRIYFGELTFHHGGGFEPIYPQEWDFKLGSLLDLPKL